MLEVNNEDKLPNVSTELIDFTVLMVSSSV